MRIDNMMIKNAGVSVIVVTTSAATVTIGPGETVPVAGGFDVGGIDLTVTATTAPRYERPPSAPEPPMSEPKP